MKISRRTGIAAMLAAFGIQAQDAPRPMQFLDVLALRSVRDFRVSPDGARAVYSLGVPDWQEAKTFTDLYVVSMKDGASSTRQMTFTRTKNESSPVWTRDSKRILFLSNREAPSSNSGQEQLYLLSPEGGEAQKITEAREGVSSFALSKDGQWLGYLTGKQGERQIWLLPLDEIDSARPEQLTRHATGITWWQFAPDSKSVYFTAPDEMDKPNRERIEKKFTARIRNPDTPVSHLWNTAIESKAEKRLTSAPEYSVDNITISGDGAWIAFRGTPRDRYQRTVSEANIYADLYLLNVASGQIERLTNNEEISEEGVSFSRDNKLLAFSAPELFQYARRKRVYVRSVSASGGNWRMLGGEFIEDVSTGIWSADSRTIYFGAGVGATRQLLALDMASNAIAAVTKVSGTVQVSEDEDSRALVIRYSDARTPGDVFTAASIGKAADQASWIRLTEANPQVRKFALGETAAVKWKSTDGTLVEGILTKPVNYRAEEKYPLVVMIHGGPASADTLSFGQSANAAPQVYAGAGYAVLRPNYRGSTNYGEKFRMQISGDYFRQAYEDIMAGVDHLIHSGIADGSRMGVMGWSAGGHWSNWILTHTDRFKAISSGAGAVNWISMYAQTDVQRVREYYFNGRPYDNFEHWWNESPLKYIKNAKTPTLIHAVDGDPRVPRPQSEELHMALKKLGVPTELIVYPGTTHGIPEPRNQLVKAVSEFNWMEKWIRGKNGWLDWNELNKTVRLSSRPPGAAAAAPSEDR
jgi:dipeptidyl aminopeptidase/acylaminoacyl peptidase